MMERRFSCARTFFRTSKFSATVLLFFGRDALRTWAIWKISIVEPARIQEWRWWRAVLMPAHWPVILATINFRSLLLPVACESKSRVKPKSTQSFLPCVKPVENLWQCSHCDSRWRNFFLKGLAWLNHRVQTLLEFEPGNFHPDVGPIIGVS